MSELNDQAEKAGGKTDSIALRSLSGGTGKEYVISISLSPISASNSYATGSTPGSGTFFCLDCGSQLSLNESDNLPDCPRCGASVFRRDSIFESMQEHGESTVEFSLPTALETPDWIEEARAELQQAGRYLAYRSSKGRIQLFSIEYGWTRIGRSVAADVRLDDPSVSRRHALLVSEPGEALRVLDDRSLNGVFINSELVEWGKLEDGDELTIGRFHLFALDA